MALFPGPVKRKLDTGGDALGRVFSDSLGLRDPVCRQEANAINILGEPIRIPLHSFNSAVAVTFVDFCRQAGADTVALQKDHHLLDRFLLDPGGVDHRHSFLADPAHFGQPLRMAVNNIERFGAKMGDDALGSHRAYALDQATAQILLDAGYGRGQYRTHPGYGKLFAILRMHLPVAAQFHGLPNIDANHGAHDRRLFLPMGQMRRGPLRRQLGDGIAILFVMVGDAFDYAAQ